MSVLCKILGSTVTGGVFHFFWPIVFLVTRHISSYTLPKVKWMFALINNFAKTLVWPLIAYRLRTVVAYACGAIMASSEQQITSNASSPLLVTRH